MREKKERWQIVKTKLSSICSYPSVVSYTNVLSWRAHTGIKQVDKAGRVILYDRKQQNKHDSLHRRNGIIMSVP